MNTSQDDANREIQINNNVCTFRNDKLVKFTEILFSDRSVLIEDVYDFRSFSNIGNSIKEKSSLPSTSS